MMRSHEHDAVNCLPGTIASTASHAETSTSTCTPVSDASHEHDFACTRTHSRSSHEADAPNFDCNICLDVCYDPVVTTCGHLFCWPCLYHWLSLHSVFKECPVCKENVQLSKTIPLYGCGKVACSEFLAERFPGACIPCRPSPMMDASREPFTSGMANHGSDLADIFRRDHEDRDHRRSSYNVPSLNLGFWHLLLQVFMSLLPPYMSRLFQRIGIPSLADQGRRFNNEKEFVLHWGFIVFALLATLAFLIC